MNRSLETEFTGKRALVTCGTKGMGEAIVERLRSSGAIVVTTARSAPTDLREPDLFVGADISTSDGAERVVRYAGCDRCLWLTISTPSFLPKSGANAL